jgi:hypothetical protein
MIRKSLCLAALLLTLAAVSPGEKRVHLLPNLQPGQILTYMIRVRAEKNVKTQSRVAAPMAPESSQIDAYGLLRVEILDVQSSGHVPLFHARAHFLTLNSGVGAKGAQDKKPDANVQHLDSQGKSVEFTISQGGAVNILSGLDSLLTDQQQAWQQWADRFAFAWTLPVSGIKPGEKWNSDHSEQSPVPIAGLEWLQSSNYVRDEPCLASHLSLTAEVSPANGPADTCAVLLTNSRLKQNSSQKNATPEDFKLHDLKTSGTATGKNEVIIYISLSTGLLVRSTEETSQSMDVIVATTSDSNRVHYNVDARSHAEILLVTETPLSSH